jgi:hypothetical protein
MSKLPNGARFYTAASENLAEKSPVNDGLQLCPMKFIVYCCPMKWIIKLLAALLLAGCASSEAPEGESRALTPTGALVRGELSADQYLGAIKEANVEAREADQFEFNREPTRAYNTKSGKFEYVPDGATQKWNEATQRWEFTPLTQR